MRFLGVIVLLCVACSARAELSIEITGAGEHQVPISLVPFAGDENQGGQSISTVVSNDLLRTGLFKLVDPAGKAPHEPGEVNYVEWPGVDALLIGKVRNLDGGRLEVRFRLLDMVRRTELIGLAVTAKSEQLRAIAHRVSDLIYEKLTGDPGVFSTRIAYVNRDGKKYRLVVADSDGYGEQTLLALNEPIMSPAWSPDGSQLAYVSFERGHASVFVQSLATRKRTVLADFPGSNSAPAWSPDGKQLALVLSRDGYSQLYLVRNDGKDLHRITFSETIDTEPVFTPDGKSLLFTSDRGGSAQIYRVPVEGGSAERLTFDGTNNFSPRPSPDGKSFVFSHFVDGVFYIAVQDFETNQMQVLTGGGWEKKPSFAPNGKLILFATESQGRGILATVSSDGRVKQKMIAQRGDIREPIWGPFLKQ
ncbi:Tol-Pal system beta propeller repeat protein TolB [Sideroxydans lithotrophicus]|uniref:Tol-Pal system protein TolB n=1 Tax=Sideroxydans lithotrophicus (strain ES-1) TaxID=580332 RepID=D5CMS4_SIDLE|nr:Tol-Pal system beta propeller repeat protein TolB [Sideroxydans lithotrophicus]ADE10760.1 Tol-Pal system beta propeller repeat protein TolB [Sideroxydans lithotrophicus ES-1]